MLRKAVLSCTYRRYCSTVSDSNDLKNTKYLSLNKYDKVMTIGINRPEKRNAVNESVAESLKEAIKNFEDNDSLEAAVIFGEGGNFCAGYDLEELSESRNTPQHFLRNNLTEIYVRKPVIAAINGYAVGFGFDLALWCDLRIMDETAVLGCLGRRYGSSMSEAGICRLQSIVGLSRAMDLILTGKSVRSEEALKSGLANRIVACGTAVGQALNLATDIAKFPQAALLTDRAVLYKHAFAKVPLKNSVIDEDSTQYQEQVLKDCKQGAKLFTAGAGKNGQLFSKYLWNDV